MNPTVLIKLYSIFSEKDWHKNETNKTVFRNFCLLLENLTENQQTLLLELTQRYTWLSLNEYNGSLIQVFKKVPQEEIKELGTILLFPVMKPRDEEITKSGHAILMMFRAIKPYLDEYQHLDFLEIEKFEHFDDEDFNLEENEKIFLLDDFLGTGDTIKSTIETFLSKPNISIDNIRVFTIASHQLSIDYMESIGVKYYTNIIIDKGISDYYQSPELETNIAIMKEIEKLLPSKKFSFGYGRSEALITLYRTPNNTFPIFWQDYEKDEIKFKAPFPRY